MKVWVESCLSLLLIYVLLLPGCARKSDLQNSSRISQLGILLQETGGVESRRKKERQYFNEKEYVLQDGDAVFISVHKHPEFSDTLAVRPDGRISLPAVGETQAAGLTLKELSANVAKMLSTRLKEPEVVAILREEKPKLVYVLGEVKSESAVPLDRSATALQAIINAGGFTTRSDRKKVRLLRDFNNGRFKILTLDMTKPGVLPHLKGQNIKLRPNDIIVVNKSSIGKFNQWMDQYVAKPLGGVTSITSTILQLIILNQVTRD